MYLRMCMALVAVCLASISHAATLEVPTPNTTVSGIGVISGWKCTAEGDITIRLNGEAPFPATYGLPRLDTRSVCGDDDGNNGFFSYWNWGNLGDGEHTVVAYDNGKEFARSTFRVVTTGEEFLRGASGTCEIPDFPAPGETARFKWNQSTQHLELDSVSIAPPTASGKLYWRGGGGIHRANLDGSQEETIIDQSDWLDELAVDPTGGKLYWTVRTGTYPDVDYHYEIRRTNLDGSQEETLVRSDHDIVRIDDLVVDSTGGKLYWMASRGISYAIHRANLDGSQEEIIVPYMEFLFVVDLTGGKLYWIDDTGSGDNYRREIHRANLDGSQEEIIVSRKYSIDHLVVDPTGGKLYWIGSTVTGGGIHRANLDGSQEEIIVPVGGSHLVVDPTGGKLYWDGREGIRRVNLDGSQEEIIVSRKYSIDHLVVDSTGGKLYWSGWTAFSERIHRANLDGSQEETLVRSDHEIKHFVLVRE